MTEKVSTTEITCREGDESDLPEIARLFRKHNLATDRAEWLEWKYFKNPHGPARIYLAEDPEGKIVAVRAYIPRLCTSSIAGKFLVRQSVDLLVAEEYRGTGVYSKVREFQVNRRDYPAIGFPNELAKRITRTYPGNRRIYHPIDLWRFPARMGQLIQKKPYRFVAFLVDGLSRLYTFLWLGKRPKDMQIRPITKFEKDYKLDPGYMYVLRTADYLNWRFIDIPVQSFCCCEFMENGRSIGYCVYRVEGSRADIYDLVLNSHRRGCLRLLVDHCRSKGISHLVFKSVGFRMARYGFIRFGKAGYLDTVDTPRGNWLATLADKDWFTEAGDS